MSVEFNPVCPDESHPDGQCVTADPEDINAAGSCTMTDDQWAAMQGGGLS